MVVTVAPMEERLAVFDYDGPFHVTFVVRAVPEVEAPAARWSFRIVEAGQNVWVREGQFVLGGEMYYEDDGSLAGDLMADVGVICEPDQTEEEDCVPCDLEVGCNIEIDFDRCVAVGDEATMADLIMGPADREPLFIKCEEGEDETPCHYLDAWLESDSRPTSAMLCSEGETVDDQAP